MAGAFPVCADLRAVAQHLHALDIPHRFVLSGVEQRLILEREADCAATEQLLAHWRAGELECPALQAAPPSRSWRPSPRPAPLTLSIIFLSCVGFGLAASGAAFIEPFVFASGGGSSPWRDILAGQFWRLLSPIFLHFGPIHLLFNALWFWYLGTLVERGQGRAHLLLAVGLIGVLSNAAQAWVSGPVVFGGLSGVVYGLVAYVWAYGRLRPGSPVALPDGFFIAITALMLVSVTGLFDIIVGAEIADTAHISGYLTGLVLALAVQAADRWAAK